MMRMKIREKNQHTEHFYAGGLKEYVSWLNTDKNPIQDVLGFRKEINGATIDVALQLCSDSYSDTMLGYANSIHTIDGGTHIEGVKASLTRTLNALSKKSKNWLGMTSEKDINLNGEHVREGLTCIVSVKIPNPEFQDQTKMYLRALFPNPLTLTSCFGCQEGKGVGNKSKSVLKSSSLPGKLADYSSTNPEESGIYWPAWKVLFFSDISLQCLQRFSSWKEILLVAVLNRVVTDVFRLRGENKLNIAMMMQISERLPLTSLQSHPTPFKGRCPEKNS
ncbi:hypothetical protein Bca52824_021814 [Brassica carinata]|uniref:DNA topoisomerase (ATP-hydrolyzing) n=1 Tax=Brassica carinata TaxID=52824 RepID=A0A8X8ATN2_BRACI|nr:hypothetical protein Bca52824_021814 [Brassica carinata]